MKRHQLALIRHAKSDWDKPGQDDFERVLSDRGRRVAPEVGAFLAERGDFHPDLLVTSPAARALETARILAQALRLPSPAIREDPRIYEATPGQLARVVQDVEDRVSFLALCGHNPGMSRFADWLLGDPVIVEMPTCAVAWLDVEVALWRDLKPGCAQLLDYLTPKDLGII